MNKCEKCGFLHYRTDPCRKPKESGPVRAVKVIAPSAESATLSPGANMGEAQKVERRSPKPKAVGSIPTTCAKLTGVDLSTAVARKKAKGKLDLLPVDTNPGVSKKSLVVPLADVSTTLAGAVEDKDRQPKFDKKAWQRNYMRGYMKRRRAKLKEGQANE